VKRKLITEPQFNLLKRLDADFPLGRVLGYARDRRMAERLEALDCTSSTGENAWMITDHGRNILDLHRSFYEDPDPRQGEAGYVGDEAMHAAASSVACSRAEGCSEWATACGVISALRNSGVPVPPAPTQLACDCCGKPIGASLCEECQAAVDRRPDCKDGAEGEEERCENCGGPVGLVWWCHDDFLWEKVTGKPKPAGSRESAAGHLCISCFDTAARKVCPWIEWAPLNLRHLQSEAEAEISAALRNPAPVSDDEEGGQ